MPEKKKSCFQPGIGKDTFCKALGLIQCQEKKDAAFSDALSQMGDGHFLFGVGNEYLRALLLVLKEAVDDTFDYIGWWLYETDDYQISAHDNSKEWYLEDPGDLYDYIWHDCEHKQLHANTSSGQEGEQA